MSTTVELTDLSAAIALRGPTAFLVTVGEVGPHVVSVSVAMVGGRLEVGAGRRTARNVADHPEVTVLWPHGVEDRDNSLLVDGTASLMADGERAVITPSSAVLHRARNRGPDC